MNVYKESNTPIFAELVMNTGLVVMYVLVKLYADSLQLAKLVTSYKFKKLKPPR